MNYYAEPGEIIVIDKFLNEFGEKVSRHSFLVLSSEKGITQGMEFNMVLLLMSSFYGKSKEAREKSLSYPWNILVKPTDVTTVFGNGEDAVIKGKVLYYFKLEKNQYRTVGLLNTYVWNKLNYALSTHQDKITTNINNLNIKDKEKESTSKELIKS